MNAKEHYQAGHLAEAIAAAGEEVKKHPADASSRGFLCELLCFAGEWQRADMQLDALGQQDPQSVPGLTQFRQLIRAEQARQQFHSEGRLPEFLEPPSAWLQRHLEASIQLREGHAGEAAELLDAAQEMRPSVAGVCDGEPFDDMHDLDDLLASFFEVLTSTGKYYWIPLERVEQIEFHPPVRARDLLWRRVQMVVCGGPDGEVFLPTLYAGSFADPDDRVRLGRYTDWRGEEGGPVHGIGQRMFLFGQQDRSILELAEITVNNPVPGAIHAEN
jgi:type VI secretion system protein ImpE